MPLRAGIAPEGLQSLLTVGNCMLPTEKAPLKMHSVLCSLPMNYLCSLSTADGMHFTCEVHLDVASG